MDIVKSTLCTLPRYELGCLSLHKGELCPGPIGVDIRVLRVFIMCPRNPAYLGSTYLLRLLLLGRVLIKIQAHLFCFSNGETLSLMG